MMQSKLLNLIIQLNLPQKRDLEGFMIMRSNRLSPRDREILKGILYHGSLSKIEENEIWEAFLEESEMRNKNRIKNRLLKTIERYLSMQELDSNSTYRNFILTNYYAKLKVEKNASLLLNNSIKRLQKNINFESKIYLYWMNELALNLNKDVRRHDDSIEDMGRNLNDFYVGNRLRIICEIINRKGIVGGDDRVEEFRKEISILLKKTDSEHIRIYLQVFNLISEQSKEGFARVDDYLYYNQEALSAKITQELYGYLINFCIKELNKGDITFAKKYIDYFEYLERKGWLLENGALGIGRLQNSILAAMIIGRLDWARERINRYSSNLIGTRIINRQSFINLNMAILELHGGDLDSCHNYAAEFMHSEAYNKDIYYRLSCDKILLKIYYLNGSDNLFVNKLRNIKSYINQNKLPVDRIKKHQFFLKKIEKLNNQKLIDEEHLQDRLLIPDYIWYKKFIKKGTTH